MLSFSSRGIHSVLRTSFYFSHVFGLINSRLDLRPRPEPYCREVGTNPENDRTMNCCTYRDANAFPYI